MSPQRRLRRADYNAEVEAEANNSKSNTTVEGKLVAAASSASAEHEDIESVENNDAKTKPAVVVKRGRKRGKNYSTTAIISEDNESCQQPKQLLTDIGSMEMTKLTNATGNERKVGRKRKQLVGGEHLQSQQQQTDEDEGKRMRRSVRLGNRLDGFKISVIFLSSHSANSPLLFLIYKQTNYGILTF